MSEKTELLIRSLEDSLMVGTVFVPARALRESAPPRRVLPTMQSCWRLSRAVPDSERLS